MDPALLIYEQEHWQTRQPHFYGRITALTLHRRIIRQYSQQIAMSDELASLVYQSFPWNDEFKSIGELRDFRHFIFEELARVHSVGRTRKASDISLKPDGLTCEHVGITEIFDAWKELLCACVEDGGSTEFDTQIATWETPTHTDRPLTITLAIDDMAVRENYHIPLVWDEDSWANGLAAQDSWPDLQRCVEFYFMANPGLRSYTSVRDEPIPFEWTDGFWKSVDDLCGPKMRDLLVKAIAKRVYGILDASLHDEPLGQMRRFRVTDFWRVHYRDIGDRIVLEEFGEHDIGL